MKNIYLDFEFRNTANRYMGLVCVAFRLHGDLKTHTRWLYNSPKDRSLVARYFHKLYTEKYRFCAYSEAEARCILQMWDECGLKYDFNKWRYIDLMIEYRMILNHWHKYMYGDQYIDGKVIKTSPPTPYGLVEEENEDLHHKPEYGLAAASYKLLGVKIDTEHKNATVQLILNNSTYTPDEKEQILEYCASDIRYLEDIYKEIIKILKSRLGRTEKDKENLAYDIFRRGEYSARTAKMVREGYPVNIEALKKTVSVIPQILKAACEEVNAEVDGFKPFQWNKKAQRHIQKQQPIMDWILEQKIPNWPKTKTGRLSLDKKAFESRFNSRSEGLGGKYLKYLWTKSSLNGFLPPKVEAKPKKKFWDYVGSDGRVRPHFNIYGAQTGRSQPASTGFIPLKSYWMRSFIAPPKGRMCVTVDWGQQEFLIAALRSSDLTMIKAYESGDPYLFFAKLDGAIPKDGTKKTHAEVRDIYKTSILSILFNMGYRGLAFRLSNELQRPYPETKAKMLIESFHRSFSVFSNWTESTVKTYMSGKSFAKMKLPCGYVLWGGQRNWRSAANFPIQGMGSSIMRKSVGFAQDSGLSVIYTLHDALTIETDLNCWDDVDKLCDAMDKGFRHYFPKHLQKHGACRLDVNAWGLGLNEENVTTSLGKDVSTKSIYLDKRGEKDYYKYMKYFS